MHNPEHGPIRIHSAETLPYGAFSAFALTPVWIAGRRYQTVEHWYQAMRGVGDEHEWIRAASTPQEAKRRGSTIEPRRYWLEEKVFIMYRGMLAKCRQHPHLADLLLSTGDAEIYEACNDRFWGINQGDGSNWLGKILHHVRGYLRSPDAIGPLSGVVSGRFLNYETAVSVRNTRNGGEPWLVHLVRYREGINPIDTLRQIIDEGLLRTTRQLSGYQAVCFSAAPLRDLELKVFDREARLRIAGEAHVYSAFGIAVRYDFGRELGLRPVLSVPTEVTPALPHYLRFLTQPYSPADLLDYTHEDEWRAPFDVNITEGPFALVLPRGSSLHLENTYGIPRAQLIELLEGAGGAERSSTNSTV